MVAVKKVPIRPGLAALLAIAAVVAAGSGLFLGMRTTVRSLKQAQSAYYAHERFADVFAACTRAPESLAADLRSIPGVVDCQTRVVAAVRLSIPGMPDAVTAQLVSLPDHGRPAVNDVRLRAGRLPRPGHQDEVVASEAFVEAHAFEPGSVISAVINGREQALRIVGVGLTPEFTYSLAPGAIFPDDRRFGVLWMRRDVLGPAFDMDGAFNDVSLRTSRDASLDAVISQVDDVLDAYGGRGAIPRKHQQSHFFLENEFAQIRAQAVLLPTIFLLVAAFLLNIVIGRVIASQRPQIAVLKALGYSDRAIALHFTKLVGCVVGFGLLAGIAVAGWLGSSFIRMYAGYFRFPELPYQMAIPETLLTVGLCIGAAALGTAVAIRRTFRLPPAEAMRPEAPPSYRASLIERLGIVRQLAPSVRMVVREMERRPFRVLGSVFGIAMAGALVVASTFFFDSLRHMLHVQFQLTQHEDVTVSLIEPRELGAMSSVRKLPGVTLAEPFRAVPMRLTAGRHEQRVGMLGVPANAELQTLRDVALNPVMVPGGGVLLSRKLAELLDVSVGDNIHAAVLTGKRQTLELPVARIIESHFGLQAIMDLGNLSRLLGETPSFNGAWLRVDEQVMTEFHRQAQATPLIAGVAERLTTVRTVQRLLDQSIGISMAFALGFALVLALGILFNAARITLEERVRELASLRILGFHRAEVARILLGEIAILVVMGLPLGLLLGYGLAAATVSSPGFDNEQFSLPLVVQPPTYALAAVTILAAAAISCWSAWRRLDAINIVDVLKSRD